MDQRLIDNPPVKSSSGKTEQLPSWLVEMTEYVYNKFIQIIVFLIIEIKINFILHYFI